MKILKDLPTSISGKYTGLILAAVSLVVMIISISHIPELIETNSNFILNLLTILIFGPLFLFSLFSSFLIVNPNEKVVFSFLGKYRGTTEEEGFMIKNPFFNTKKVSLKINTIATGETKINDSEGIPLIVSLVVNYKVDQAAPFVFNSESPSELVSNTCESVLRNVVTQHAYDSDNEETETLSKDSGQFSEKIKNILNEKLSNIGVEIINANIANISYAPEIAKAMLQRQQAKKVGESKKEIVKAAVGTVNAAINNLETEARVQFNDEEKKKFLKDLMLVIVSDQATTPTISLSQKQ